MMEYHIIKELVKGTRNDTQRQTSAHPKNSSLDCDGVQLIKVELSPVTSNDNPPMAISPDLSYHVP